MSEENTLEFVRGLCTANSTSWHSLH